MPDSGVANRVVNRPVEPVPLAPLSMDSSNDLPKLVVSYFTIRVLLGNDDCIPTNAFGDVGPRHATASASKQA
jgi:hypothetical protein